ncbi:hypothetical protein PHMEG_0001691 [Phytophthora megakarya]|uniref:Uncharacterized protein n=1 Tax=Phytophthora megakarya TaxID=4795 RepID=A0A225X2K2_9STRA|nr:hypothetical protein PHMEG_0001691 [Phytophthora megakarya]
MTHSELKILPLVKQDMNAIYADDAAVTSPNLPPSDLNFDLELSFCEEFEGTITMENTPRNIKRLKPNPGSESNLDARLTSSSLEFLLDGVLSDEDLLLEIPSSDPDAELLCEH